MILIIIWLIIPDKFTFNKNRIYLVSKKEFMMKRQFNQYRSKKLQFIFLYLCLIQMVFFSQLNAQTLSVQGKVTASRFPVQNASVSFIDNADTTIKFSTLTDAAGI